MIEWHHGLNGHELEQTPGDGEDKHVAVHGLTRSQS